MSSVIKPKLEFTKRKPKAKPYVWFIGLYFASLAVIGTFHELSHWLITLLPQ